MNDLRFLELESTKAAAFAEQIAALRIAVFAEWPYLYDGDPGYELNYLKNYFASDNSFIVLALDGDTVVGASTAIWLPDAEEAFQKPFFVSGIPVQSVCYYGESVLLPQYRGRGAGKTFMGARENFSRRLPGVGIAAFCSVVRPDDHLLKPTAYRSLAGFWQAMGFMPREGMLAYLSWPDIGGGSVETEKSLQFWLKELK